MSLTVNFNVKVTLIIKVSYHGKFFVSVSVTVTCGATVTDTCGITVTLTVKITVPRDGHGGVTGRSRWRHGTMTVASRPIFHVTSRHASVTSLHTSATSRLHDSKVIFIIIIELNNFSNSKNFTIRIL